MEGENEEFVFDQAPQSKRDRIFEQIQQLGVLIDKQKELLRLQRDQINDQQNTINEKDKIIRELEIKIREQEKIINGNNVTSREINVDHQNDDFTFDFNFDNEPGLDPSWVITDPEYY